jgi:hypothetical protein
VTFEGLPRLEYKSGHPANRFYESMGFVPIAYRGGSKKKKRVHIFWQKRIREGDAQTPWWFPSETRGGLMDAARIALPIMPGVKWSDELPVLSVVEGPVLEVPEVESEMEESEETPVRVPKPVARKRNPGGFYFGPAEVEKPSKPKKIKKVNPELASKARELRDKYLEQFNANPPLLAAGPIGKYEVARQIDTNVTIEVGPKLLAA